MDRRYNTPRPNQNIPVHAGTTGKQQFYRHDNQQKQRYGNNYTTGPNSGCFHCGEMSHFKRDCPYLRNPQARHNNVNTTENKRQDLN